METHLDPKTVEKGRRGLRGTSLLTVLFALIALIAAASLSIDVGVIWLARTQAQNASDAAALAAAATMIGTTGPSRMRRSSSTRPTSPSATGTWRRGPSTRPSTSRIPTRSPRWTWSRA
jgi:hypothetical protein